MTRVSGAAIAASFDSASEQDRVMYLTATDVYIVTQGRFSLSILSFKWDFNLYIVTQGGFPLYILSFKDDFHSIYCNLRVIYMYGHLKVILKLKTGYGARWLLR